MEFKDHKCAELYDKVIKYEEIAQFRMFDYKSLGDDGLDLFMDFIMIGMYRFCGFSCDYYPKLIREFYSNIWIDELDDKFDVSIIKSWMNKLFHFSNYDGQKCRRYTLDGPAKLWDKDEVVERLLEKYKVQKDVEI